MGINQIRAALHLRIDQIDDRFLRVMYVMAETYLKEQREAKLEASINSTPPNPEWKPMTEEELLTRLEEASEQIKKGEYLSLDELTF
ncbi:MAG TPA: hypothetical protein ENK52_01440 [Saprospiraceae bacterium]|nr:hypothetical protein [Saprospiraceae bacterium]